MTAAPPAICGSLFRDRGKICMVEEKPQPDRTRCALAPRLAGDAHDSSSVGLAERDRRKRPRAGLYEIALDETTRYFAQDLRAPPRASPRGVRRRRGRQTAGSFCPFRFALGPLGVPGFGLRASGF